MTRPLRTLFLFTFLLIPIASIHAQRAQPVQVSSLRPQLVWQRVPSVSQEGSAQVSTMNNSLEGPVLYQLVFRFVAHDGTLTGNGSPGLPLAIANGGVNTPQLATGAVTFSKLSFGAASNGQVLMANGSGGASWQTASAGTITSLSAGAGLAASPSPITTTGTLSIANSGVTPIMLSATGSTNGQVLTSNGSAVSFQDLPAAQASWLLSGNTGTVAGANYIGTNDNQPFEVHVGNNGRVLRIEPQIDGNGNGPAPNVIGGFSGNAVTGGAFGATIAGGGESNAVNAVSASFGSVGGGLSNTASGTNAAVGGGLRNTASGADAAVAGGIFNTASGGSATVAGGFFNTASGNAAIVAGGGNNIASGDLSFAAGNTADTNSHSGAFVWKDSSFSLVKATNDNQFVAQATGGFQFVTGLDFRGNLDPSKMVSLAPNSGIITFASGQTFPGTVAGVTAGPGLSGGGTSSNVSLQASLNHNGTLAGNGGTVALGIAAGGVSTPQIANGAVTTAQIGDGAVTTAQMGDGSVTPAKIGSGAATNGQVLTANGTGGAGFQNPSTQFSHGLQLDTSDSDTGVYASSGPNNNNGVNLVHFGSGNSGEGIGSQRASNGGVNGNNQFGLDFYTNYTNRMSIDGVGSVHVGGLSINSSGVVTFAGAQTFPGTGPGTVTSVSNSDGFLSVTSPNTTPVINLNTANTDARYVQKAGDTMAGALTLPADGLTVGGTQLVATGGNVSIGGNATVGGRISLGIYVETDTPTTAIWDETCSKNANDVAIGGGAFAADPGVLRESRPTTSLTPGNTGAPTNSWRVTCSNGGADTKCVQAYVVCLSHASP